MAAGTTSRIRDILLNKNRMPERFALARDNKLPTEVMMDISRTYVGIAEKIIGQPLVRSANPETGDHRGTAGAVRPDRLRPTAFCRRRTNVCRWQGRRLQRR